jgi:hypothetical protein
MRRIRRDALLLYLSTYTYTWMVYTESFVIDLNTVIHDTRLLNSSSTSPLPITAEPFASPELSFHPQIRHSGAPTPSRLKAGEIF